MSQPIEETAMRRAVDRTEIQELLTRYTTAVDARRWELLDEVFTNGAAVDFLANGGIKDTYPAIGKWLAEVMAHFAAYQHYLTNFSISVEADTATARFYVLLK